MVHSNYPSCTAAGYSVLVPSSTAWGFLCPSKARRIQPQHFPHSHLMDCKFLAPRGRGFWEGRISDPLLRKTLACKSQAENPQSLFHIMPGPQYFGNLSCTTPPPPLKPPRMEHELIQSGCETDHQDLPVYALKLPIVSATCICPNNATSTPAAT